jgi:selenocysteine lyase/cysteine desulfurase
MNRRAVQHSVLALSGAYAVPAFAQSPGPLVIPSGTGAPDDGAAQPADPDWWPRLMKKMAAFVGAPAESVALLRNTTEGVTTVINNWPLLRGDEILTSSAEHGPFYGALAARAARDGVVPKQYHLPAPTTSLDAIVTVVGAALTPRTKLVMFGQVVLTGQIMPVRPIADLVHACGAHLLVDGVLGLGHVPTDVTAIAK